MEIGTVVVRRNGKGWGVCAGAGGGVCGWVFSRAQGRGGGAENRISRSFWKYQPVLFSKHLQQKYLV